MSYQWDNYTRELVKGWSRLGMSACEISLAWPWDKAPTGQDVLKLQLEMSVYVNGNGRHCGTTAQGSRGGQ